MSVTSGTEAATYTYLANSPLVNQISLKQNSATRMTTTKQYDKLNRLLSVSSAPSASPPVTHHYLYNDANERIRVTQADDSYCIYKCDSLGKIKSGKRYWSHHNSAGCHIWTIRESREVEPQREAVCTPFDRCDQWCRASLCLVKTEVIFAAISPEVVLERPGGL